MNSGNSGNFAKLPTFLKTLVYANDCNRVNVKVKQNSYMRSKCIGIFLSCNKDISGNSVRFAKRPTFLKTLVHANDCGRANVKGEKNSYVI